ncbi:MAG: carbohydrate binding domain-containing protein, partial [Nocardioides sp.]
GLPAAIAATDGFRRPSPEKSPTAGHGPNLVRNGDFEDGLAGWQVNNQRRQRLSLSDDAASGDGAAALSRTTRGRVVVHDAANTVTSARAGRTYALTAFVRSPGAEVRGRLRVREVGGQRLVARGHTKFRASSGSWTKVTLTYVARRAGSELDLAVRSARVRPGATLLVDNVSMYLLRPEGRPAPIAPRPTGLDPSQTPSASAADTATPRPSQRPSVTAKPSPTPSASPTKPPAVPASGCVSDPMGIPKSGAYLGAAVNGSRDLTSVEEGLGQTLALHRTYYGASQIDGAVRQAKSDLAMGRLPWISFKAPYSWSQMAAGAGDAWATQLADALKTVPGPVWLAVHHEPENDGDIAQWTAMQARIAPIIHARTDNVAYSVIYSGWNTFGGGRNTLATKWPGDQHIDILAIDAYNDMGATRSGRVGTRALDIRAYYQKMAAWAATHGTKGWAIGETGQTRRAAAEDPQWLDRAFRDLVALGGSGLSYYDSSANSVADWTLSDSVKFSRFKGLIDESVRVC